MIRYAPQHTIDRSKYDHCVRMDSSGLVYGFSWYLDAVTDHWDALVLNDYDAVWPLAIGNKWAMKYFYRPFGVQQLGIFSKVELDEDTLREFIKGLQANCRYADVYLNEGQYLDAAALAKTTHELNDNYVLDLSTSYRDLYHSYKTNTKRNIKKAAQNKLSIFENDGPEVLLSLFKDYRAADLNLPDAFYRNVEKVMYQCLHKNLGKVWTVYGERNDVCAGAFFIETEARSIFFFSGTSPEGRERQAMSFLLNEYIIWGSEKNILLDFEGSKNQSLARFYAGFGAESKPYLRLKYNALPAPIKWFKK